MALRRPVAAVAALVLAVEAVGIVLLHGFLGMVVEDQEMSLAGLEPRAMTLSTWIAGVLFGACLLLCTGVLLRTVLTDKAPAGFLRIVLIGAAVVHGVLGALTVGLVGWHAFVFMMAVLALLVWTLVGYGDERGPREADRRSTEQGPDDGTRGRDARPPSPEPTTS